MAVMNSRGRLPDLLVIVASACVLCVLVLRGAPSKQEVARAERLAQEGTPAAQVAWGIMHENGDGLPPNATEASKWYRLAAEQGDAEGAFRLGWLYARGEGLPRNLEQAAHWYEIAAKQGFTTAQLSLGWLYFNGDGIERDVGRAARWFTLAADAGDANAQYTLGLIYSGTYEDVPVDRPAAARRFEQAAKQGLATAQFRLGAMYATGDGVTANDEEACYWLSLAVARLPEGSFKTDAETERSKVMEHLSSGQREAITRRVAAWKP